MSLQVKQRQSGSPFVESITSGYASSAASVIRPAESHWHLVLVRQGRAVRSIVVGPWSGAGVATWEADAEMLWIKFKIGTFMPHLPIQSIMDRETILPGAANASFYLHGSTWQVPTFENVDTFVDRLARSDILVRDPVVNAALLDQPQTAADRTIRHRFLRATGLTQSKIRQIERAQQAAEMLRQGISIPDTMFESGYFDQPHLTRSLKQWVGHTPAQLLRLSTSE